MTTQPALPLPSYLDPAMTTEERAIAELIHRRRRQLVVHATIYYRLHTSIVSDAQWDDWAAELVRLQAEWPGVSARVDYLESNFRTFDGSTGFDLPVSDPAVVGVAHRLIRLARSRDKNGPSR